LGGGLRLGKERYKTSRHKNKNKNENKRREHEE
jgi:hypothetical protein